MQITKQFQLYLSIISLLCESLMHMQECTTAPVCDAVKAGVVEPACAACLQVYTVHKTAFINMSEYFNLLIRTRLHRR